jgi:DNA-binding transcriptional regulator GbsR (MarR family)
VDGLLYIWTACVDGALSGHQDAQLIVRRAEKRIAEVISVARIIERGSRRERSDAVTRLIKLAESETPDLIDAVVAAVVEAIREVAAEQGWSPEHTSRLEERAVQALTALERTLDELRHSLPPERIRSPASQRH